MCRNFFALVAGATVLPPICIYATHLMYAAPPCSIQPVYSGMKTGPQASEGAEQDPPKKLAYAQLDLSSKTGFKMPGIGGASTAPK